MTRVDLDAAFQPLPKIKWPGTGEEVEVKPINFRQQRIAAGLETGKLDAFDVLPGLVAELVPSKTQEQIEAELNGEQMMLVVYYANRNVDKVQAYLEELAGKSVAGTPPPSSPPTPSGTSSAASPAPTGAPCGAS